MIGRVCFLLLGLLIGMPGYAADLLIENVTVVSAHLNRSAGNQYVLIQDERIARISAQPIEMEDVTRIDGTGKFLTPGLTDAHHHVSFAPGLGPLGYGLAAKNPKLEWAYVQQQPRSLLYYGVTQILDPSPLSAWTEFVAAPQRPDLFRCGEIPNEGGYPANQVQDERFETAFKYRLTDTSDKSTQALVRRIANDGAICIKLYIENGFGDEDAWPIFDDDTIQKIATQAKVHGLLLYAHANAIDMYQIALRNGVNVLGHGLWNWQWPAGEPPVEKTLQAIVDSGVGYVGTHRVMAGLAAQLDTNLIDKSELAKTVPAALLAWYETDEAQWFAEELASDFGEMPRSEMAQILRKGHVRAQQATKWLYDAGHPLMFGSDCPGSPTFANQPGVCTRLEIKSHIDAGIPADAVFVAATLNNAVQLGLDDRYGTVEVGKIGNLLVLGEDPSRSGAAWDTLETVILRGVAIGRGALGVAR